MLTNQDESNKRKKNRKFGPTTCIKHPSATKDQMPRVHQTAWKGYELLERKKINGSDGLDLITRQYKRMTLYNARH